MPAGFEYHLDYRVIDAAAWDLVTLGDLEGYHLRAARLPDNLERAVEYLDLSEALALQVSYVGAMQLSAAYERFIDRGIRGVVIHAPDEAIHEEAGMIISTCAMVGGGLRDGYRLTRAPVPLREVHRFLDRGGAEEWVKVA